MTKEDFIYPVEVRPLYIGDGEGNFIESTHRKATVNIEENRIVAVVGNDYTLIRNEEVLGNTIGALEELGLSYVIDPVTSFSTEGHIICNAILTGVQIHDGDSPILLSLYVRNSYDKWSALSFEFGTFRAKCSNGAFVGYKPLMKTFYGRHTKMLSIKSMKDKVQKAIQVFPELEKRIKMLQKPFENTDHKAQVVKYTNHFMGANFKEYADKQKVFERAQSIYDCWNIVTEYTTHELTANHRESYYKKIAKEYGI